MAPPKDYSRLPFVVQDNYTYSFYYQGLVASGYSDTLADEAGPFTILVPNNDAMATAGFTYPQYNDRSNYFVRAFDPPLKDYVRYMIIPKKIAFSSLPLGDNQPFTTLKSTPVYVTKYLAGNDTVITVNGITVISNARDITASNGLIDVITSVPEPQIYPNLWQRMLNDGSLTFFTTAIQHAGLQSLFEDPMQSLTVLAPSNLGFTQALWSLNGLPDLSTINGIVAADPAILKKVIMVHVFKGLRFTNDFARVDTVAGDSVLLGAYDGSILKYTQQQFISKAVTHNIVIGTNPVTGAIGYGPYGPDTIPVVANYFSEFQIAAPAVTFLNRPTGNGILHEIDNVMLP